MGDYILMKILYIILLFVFINQLSANELKWVDEQVAAIKPPRTGILNKDITKLQNPFVFLVKTVVEKGNKSSKKVVRHVHYVRTHYYRRLHLEAIFNKSVMINKKWYKEGHFVHGYKIVKISGTSVVLQKQNKRLILSTLSKSKNLKIYNK